MAGIQKSLRLPPETLHEIERMSRETARDFSSVTIDLLSEAIKMRRNPGILFVEGVSGRRARVAGTGIEVWEIVANYKTMGGNVNRLRKTYHWLSAEQLRAALGYYAAYPEEIDRLIEQNESWSQQEVKARYPATGSLK
jgi:uncharacterized protein (DUF433 family)